MAEQQTAKGLQTSFITSDLEQSLTVIRETFTYTPDLVIRRLVIRQTGELAALIYMEDLIDRTSLNNNVLDPLQFTIEALRQSRSQQDANYPGSIQGTNFQVMLIGKRMLEYEDWFRTLDVIFRDSRNTVTDRIIAVDGPVSDVMHIKAKDQPPISVFLKGMVDSSSARSETVKTTAQELHRQLYDRAVTPSVSEVKMQNGRAILKGTALLDQRGVYKTSIGYQETVLLQILRGEAKPGVSLTFAIPGIPFKKPFATDRVSISLGTMKVKIKPSYKEGRFHYSIRIKSVVVTTEELFPIPNMPDNVTLAAQIEEQMRQQIEKLIAKFQKNRIDPAGFGLYARAYQYRHFKQAENHWGEELSNAKFDVSVHIRIGANGPVKW